MSDISPITNTATTASNTSTSTIQQSDIGKEFNTFIELLTAQVRNQDPLAPLDSTQFVEQLATFSALEQQVRSNESLETISALISDLHTMAASDWLGENVTVESSWVPFAGETVEFDITPPEQADRAILTVRNTDGTVAWSESLDTSAERHSWTGQLSDGGFAANDSLYQVSIDYYQDDAFIGSAAPRLVTTVTDVATENGKLRLGTAMRLTAEADAVRLID